MARLEEADEDFKLPLRPWLEKQINSGKFKGLEWEVFDGETKLFRLPWVKKNLPDWEQYYMIFRAWADHRGRGEAEGLDDSKLKSNFRCALNKSVDFEEITSRSQLQRQTGNYKVYRIRTPKEVRERKKNRSKFKTKQEHNFNDDEMKTIEKQGLDLLDSLGASTSVSMVSNSMDIDASTIDFSALVPTESLSPGTYLTTCPDVTTGDQMGTIRLPDVDEFSPALAISPAPASALPVWKHDVEMEDIENESANLKLVNDEVSNSAAAGDKDGESEDILPLIIALENAGIKRERLCQCKIIVTYNGEKVLEKDVPDLDQGYRIFYGDKDKLMRVLKSRSAPEEKLADFKLQGIQLPDLQHQNHTMSAILKKTDLGIVVRYNPHTLQICAKRLCQSQVFFYDPHDHSSTSEVKKLEREETVEIFSHKKYVLEYLDKVINYQDYSPPEADTILTVGIRPKSRAAIEVMKGLKIELIPYALQFFMKNNRQQASNISLCFSSPNSIETLLRFKEKCSPAKDSVKT